MTNEPLSEIMQTVVNFKEKFKDVKQRILAYFSQIRKHRQVALSNHYKMLFEFVSEIESVNLHIQVLAQVHRHLQRDLLGPVDYRIFPQYFRYLSSIAKEKLYLKMAEVTLSMIDKVDKNSLSCARQITEIVSILRQSPNRILETATQCTEQFLKKLQDFSKVDNGAVILNMQFFLRQLCLEFVSPSINPDNSCDEEFGKEIFYVVLMVIQAILCVDGSKVNRNPDLLAYAYQIVSRKQEQVDSSPIIRKACLESLVKISFICESKMDSTIMKLLSFAKESHQNQEHSAKLLRKIYSWQGLPKVVYCQTKIVCEHIQSVVSDDKLSSNIGLAVACSTIRVISVQLMAQLLESIQNSKLSHEEQLDETRIVIEHLQASMKTIRNHNPTGAILMSWTQLFHQMLKTAFRYRIQTNLVLKLTKYSQDLFLDTVEKYDSYFAQEEYWAVYHLIFRRGFIDIYADSSNKVEMRLSGLKKLIIDCLARGKHEQVQFGVKTLKCILNHSEKQVPTVSRKVEQICAIICDKGQLHTIKLLMDMLAEAIRHRKSLEIWIKILKECEAQQIQIKMQIIDIISELIQDEGERLSFECWDILIDIISESCRYHDKDYLHRVLALLQTIVQQYIDIFPTQVVEHLLNCLTQYPADEHINVKDKYKLCGLLWIIGQKHKQRVISRIAHKLEQFCYDEVAEVAINGLCVYSSLGLYDGYERMSQRILKSGKESVIISYLHNYVKIVKRALSQEIYYRVNEFIVNNLPELYELALNEIIIESTVCHAQLTKITYKQIFRDPEYFQLSLYFYINLLSQKPKEIRLVRYSIPKMMVVLLNQLEFLSSCPQFSDSILLKDCMSLLQKIIEYPSLTNSVFNLEKHKIYFEQDEFQRYVEVIYNNLRGNLSSMTDVLMYMPISRNLMVNHTNFVIGSRLAWLQLLGEPKDLGESKKYKLLFQKPEELDFIGQSDWHFKDYLAVYGILQSLFFGELITRLENASRLDIETISLVGEDPQDNTEIIRKKAQVLRCVLNLTLKILSLSTTNEETKYAIIKQLSDIYVSPLCFEITFKDATNSHSAFIRNKQFHLVYLSMLVSQTGITTTNNELKSLIFNVLIRVAEAMNIPHLP